MILFSKIKWFCPFLLVLVPLCLCCDKFLFSDNNCAKNSALSSEKKKSENHQNILMYLLVPSTNRRREDALHLYGNPTSKLPLICLFTMSYLTYLGIEYVTEKSDLCEYSSFYAKWIYIKILKSITTFFLSFFLSQSKFWYPGWHIIGWICGGDILENMFIYS